MGTLRPDKATQNMTFDVNYAEGETKHVETGILFEVEPDGIHTGLHMGTTKAIHVFAAIATLEEMVEMAGLTEQLEKYKKVQKQNA